MQKLIFTQLTGEELAKLIVDEMEARSLMRGEPISEKADPDERFLGDAAVAKYLGCTVQTINELKENKEIPYHRYGRKYYYIRSEIDAVSKIDNRRFGELRGRRKKQ